MLGLALDSLGIGALEVYDEFPTLTRVAKSRISRTLGPELTTLGTYRRRFARSYKEAPWRKLEDHS